jgi:hypothetical protein
LTLASSLYAADTGFHAAYNDAAETNGLWMGLATGYGQQKQILVCPLTHDPPTRPEPSGAVDPSGAADLTWARWGEAGSWSYVGSYALNGWLYDQATYTGANHPELMMSKQSTIQKPSQTPVFLDANWVDLWPLESDAPSVDLYNGMESHGGMPRCTIARHGIGNPANAPRV